MEELGKPKVIREDISEKESLSTNESPENIIVEVGSGTIPYLNFASHGYHKRFFENPSLHYVALDLNAKDLKESKDDLMLIDKELAQSGRMHYVKADGVKLPFSDGSVAQVILSNIPGNLRTTSTQRENMIREAARVLKIGGIMKFVEIYDPHVTINEDLLSFIRRPDSGFEEIQLRDITTLLPEEDYDRELVKQGATGSFILNFRKKDTVPDLNG